MTHHLVDSYIARLQNAFNAIGKRCFVGIASNPIYLEVYARCNIVQFEACIQGAGLVPIGIALDCYDHEDWYMTWLKPNDLLSA